MVVPRPASDSPVPPHRVSTRVYACVPEFELVYLRSTDGFQYVLTPDTAGLRLEDLQEGQEVECLVSGGLPRVVSATLKLDGNP